ncbi:MAG TPA: PQQ-binding-like beta-propeller repeat protein [Armatimonadota bacterium]|jgi:outer membrane protein assembly factor BamB
MSRSLLAAMLIACLCAPLIAGAADWPQFRGPNADGFAPDKNINTDWTNRPPKELWRVTLSDDGYAGPSVADGKVFIIDHDEKNPETKAYGKQAIVRALDLQTGQDVWRFTYENTANFNYGFTRSTPVYNNGKLYIQAELGTIYCLNAKTGAKIWERDIMQAFAGKMPGWRLAMSPLIDGNKLIACPGGADASVVALNKETGETIWAGGGSEAPGYATPVVATIDGKRQYLVFAKSLIMGVAADNGALLWSFPWKTGADVNASAPIAISSNRVFISSAYNHGCCVLEVTNGQVRTVWQNLEIQAHFSTPLFYQGMLYCTSHFSGPGALVCLDPNDGTAKWKQPLFEKGGLVGVDGMMVVADGKTGDVVLAKLDPTSYQELGRIKPLGGQSWTAPIIANGKLLVRNKSAMVCLDLSK